MLTPADIPGFIAPPHFQPGDTYLLADYTFETDLEPSLAAAQLCSEQSTAQWARPGVNEDFRKNCGALVVDLTVFQKPSSSTKICRVRIAHPLVNFGARIPNLLSALAGEGPFYCPGILTIRLDDVFFPDSFASQFPGPQFGLQALREQLQVFDRPFFIGVVKPNLGLDPQSFADLASEAWVGGLDIAKDDEMLADAPYSPLSLRMKLCAQKRRLVEQQSGRKRLMIANITDEPETMPQLLHDAVEAGANAVMVNGVFAGLGAYRLIRNKSSVPLMGHFTGQALYERIPTFGISGTVIVKLSRLAGCDIIGIPGFGPRMKSDEAEVLRQIRACLEPLGGLKPALPVPGGSDNAATLPGVAEKIGHADFGFIAGRGVFGHPDGPAAGARSLHVAWEKIR